jgi:subtilisin-like proprotein convertase family protein
VMAIGAVGADGRRAPYSERGANVWLCTPSSGSGPEVFTTDRTGAEGYNDGRTTTEPADAAYTSTFGGTSSATPAAAGAAALVVAANPALSWRDVRRVLALTARKHDPSGAHWSTNGAGHRVSSDCGFGVVDASAAVAAARTWTSLPPARAHSTPTLRPALAIPDDDAAGVRVATTIQGSGIRHVEWVEVHFDSGHDYAGDLRITLRNESTGTESVLATPHQCAGACRPYSSWRFGTARHLDEAADGTWSLVVADEGPKDLGSIRAWRLVFHGHGER